MDLQTIAARILCAVAEIGPETRYEERDWRDDEGKLFKGTNVMLRDHLGGQHAEWFDLVLDQGRAWIQIKQSWTWMTFRKPSSKNGNYRDHLLGESDNSALIDARDKLPRLIGRPGVEVIGLLVIALDSDQRLQPQSDIALLEQLAGLDRQPWQSYSRPRWKSKVPGYETIGIQPFLWLCPAEKVVTVNVEVPQNSVSLASMFPSTIETLEARFARLAAEWKRDSRFLSNSAQMAMLRPYQRIIGMGMPVVPLILQELTREPDQWFWALEAITEQNPVPPAAAGKVALMAQAWIDWGMS